MMPRTEYRYAALSGLLKPLPFGDAGAEYRRLVRGKAIPAVEARAIIEASYANPYQAQAAA